jgi:murein DD-endopeptidase MepM/ murein hydrolase activator NlpD
MMRQISVILIFLTFSLINHKCEKQKDPEVNPLSCMDRFSIQKSHKQGYILPFPPGKRYILSQTCCNPDGGHNNQLAYDFAVYMGDTVCSMRSGIVKEMREDQPDTGGEITSSSHNYLMIEHDDGTIAFYAHLMQNEVLVDMGSHVEQGQEIALSGNSGNTLNFPHLHVGLYESYPPTETYDLPIVFKNVQGPVDEYGRLIADSWYTALDYD